MCRGVTCASDAGAVPLTASGLMRGLEVDTLDLCLTAVAYVQAVGAIRGLRMLQARAAAGTLVSASSAIGRVPLELWTSVENTLINVGWTLAYDRFYAEVEIDNCCGCATPCSYTVAGINARTFRSASRWCADILRYSWDCLGLYNLDGLREVRRRSSVVVDCASRS